MLDGDSHRHDRRGRRRLDEPPGVGLFQNPGRKLRVEGMAGTVRHQMPNHRIADERQIAHRVENLVADEFVLEPQRIVQHACFAENDGVLERGAAGQPRRGSAADGGYPAVGGREIRTANPTRGATRPWLSVRTGKMN